MNRIDEILALLDVGSQHDIIYERAVVPPSGCWRCDRALGRDDGDTCAECRELMLDEDERPAPRRSEWERAPLAWHGASPIQIALGRAGTTNERETQP